MKKTVFCTLLILSLALGIVAYAAVETTDYDVFKPEIFWNDGNVITVGGTDYPAGTLPTDAEPFNGSGELGNQNRAKQFLANIPSGSTAAAGKEDPTDTDPSANIVLKAAGSVVLTYTKANVNASAYPAPGIPNTRSVTKIHSVKVNFADTEGTIGLFNFAKAGVVHELQNSKTAVLVKNGGVYMQKSTATDVTEVEVIAPDTLQPDTWYTFDVKHDIYATGYLAGKVTIKDAAGETVGESDWMRIGDGDSEFITDVSSSTSTGIIQHYTDGVTSVMLDDWKMTKVTGLTAKTTLSLTADDGAYRKTHKLTSGLGLVGTDFSQYITVDGLTADDYTVTYDDTTDAIVVTMNEALPFGETHTIRFNKDSFIESEEGFVAFDYSTVTETYTVGPYPDLFTATISGDGATVTLSNADIYEREYLIITSHFSGGMYMGTKAVYGTVPARVDAVTPTAPSPVSVPAFTTASGDTVKVIVWDNWKNMNSLATEVSVAVP